MRTGVLLIALGLTGLACEGEYIESPPEPPPIPPPDRFTWSCAERGPFPEPREDEGYLVDVNAVGREATPGGRWWIGTRTAEPIPSGANGDGIPLSEFLSSDPEETSVRLLDVQERAVDSVQEWFAGGTLLHQHVPETAVPGDVFVLEMKDLTCPPEPNRICKIRFSLVIVPEETTYRTFEIVQIEVQPWDMLDSLPPGSCDPTCFEDGHFRPIGTEILVRWRGGPVIMNRGFEDPGPLDLQEALFFPPHPDDELQEVRLVGSPTLEGASLGEWHVRVYDPMTLSPLDELSIRVETAAIPLANDLQLRRCGTN